MQLERARRLVLRGTEGFSGRIRKTFMVAERKAREGRNPRTGGIISIPAGKVPKFVAGKGFKEAVK